MYCLFRFLFRQVVQETKRMIADPDERVQGSPREVDFHETHLGTVVGLRSPEVRMVAGVSPDQILRFGHAILVYTTTAIVGGEIAAIPGGTREALADELLKIQFLLGVHLLATRLALVQVEHDLFAFQDFTGVQYRERSHVHLDLGRMNQVVAQDGLGHLIFRNTVTIFAISRPSSMVRPRRYT